MPIDYMADLQARWRPTENQVALADVLVAKTGNPVYTLHLLVGKTYGVWTGDEAVVGLDGLFTDRATALEALKALTKTYHETTGRTVTGGYARHYAPGEWAVWDDIMSEFEGKP